MSRTVTGNTSVLSTDNTIFCDCTLNPITLILPDVTTITSGQAFNFVKTDLTSNNLTIIPLAGQMIEDVFVITIRSDALFNNSYSLQAITVPGFWKNPKSNYPVPGTLTLVGGSGSGGGGGASLFAAYVLQGSASAGLPNSFGLASLVTGLLKNTGGPGTLSVAIPQVDYESALGSPSSNGQILSSTHAGARSWRPYADFQSFTAPFLGTTGSLTASFISNNNPIDNTGLLSLNLNFAVNGANGLDTGSIAPATLYYIYIIYGTSPTALIASINSANPIFPAGYTQFIRVGALLSHPSLFQLYPSSQNGNRTKFTQDIVAVNTGANQAVTPFALGPYLPSTAMAVQGTFQVHLFSNVGEDAFVGPSVTLVTAEVQSLTGGVLIPFDIFLLTLNIYYGTSGFTGGQTMVIRLTGWTDNL
jgi:hypothetical protein